MSEGVKVSPRPPKPPVADKAPAQPIASPIAPSINRCIAIAVVAAILVASAVPPFQIVSGSSKMNVGYSFLLSPANYNGGSEYYAESVNFPILILEYVAILSTGFLAWLIAPWAWLAGFGRPPNRQGK